jgi:cytochrome c biogenesis protein CcmG/thiol:disulfide interchange protein DsbE
MDKNYEMDLNHWVDEKLATLGAGEGWQPDTERALARFKEQRSRTERKLAIWRWITVPALAVGLCLVALPQPRLSVLRFCQQLACRNVNSRLVSADVKKLVDGQAAPDLHLKDAWGQDVQVSAHKGKVVLLNFWATWCEGCQKEIPTFIEFQDKYRNRGFAAIGVSMDAEGWAKVKPYLETSKINYAVVVGNDDVAKEFGLGSMPMTYLIDRDGKIAATYVGLVDKSNCENAINRLLHK